MDLVLDKDVQGDVSVDVSFAFGTTAAGDFTNTTQAFTFTGGTADTLTVTVPTVDDNVLETDETFFAYLALTAGNSEVDVTDTAIATIIDNDDATVTIADASVTEGGNILMDLVLDKDVQGDVSVDVSFAFGTTAAGATFSYFTNTTQAFTFTGGTADTLTVTVPTVDDNVLETDETFFAYLALTAGNSEVDVTDTAVATIIDNDDATVTIADASVTEGGNILMDLVLDKDVQGDVSVDVSFAFGTTAAGDFTNTTQAFTFTGGTADTLTVTVPTDDDNLLETDETFFAYLALTAGNSEVDVTDTAVATIIDNDDATVTIADASVTEGGDILMDLVLDKDVQGDVSVDVSFAFGTTAAGDFTNTTQAFTFTGGTADTLTVTVPTDDDNLLETDETFFAYLALTAGNSEVDVTDTAIATIIDNDDATVTIADASVTEGGNILMDLVLDKDVQGDVSVDVSFAFGTTAAGDFTNTTQAFTFTGGTADTLTVTVPTDDDNLLETDETFFAYLALTAGNSEVDVTDTAIATIIDNDDATVTIADASVTEGGNILMDLVLDKDVQGDVSVDVSFAFGTTAAGDFTNTTQAFTFTGGTADTLTVTVPTVDDNVLETDETFFAYLALTAGNSEVDVTDTAVATIIDNDDAWVLP